MLYRITLVLTALLLLAGLAQAQALPTMQDLHAMHDAASWQPLVVGTARVLQLKGDAAAAYDRADVARMKVEAHVHLSQFTPAVDTATTAAKEPATPQAVADRFSALAMLFKESDSRGYKPPATATVLEPPTYEVVDPAQRDKALAALWDAHLLQLTKRCDGIGDATQFPQTVTLAHDVVDASALERTVTGLEARSDALLDTIQGKAVARMQKWISNDDDTLKQYWAAANETVVSHGVTKRRGLIGSQRQVLMQMNAGCRQWTTNIRLLVEAAGLHAKPQLIDLTDAMKRLNDRVNTVEFDRYDQPVEKK